jgi:hypothetical protein
MRLDILQSQPRSLRQCRHCLGRWRHRPQSQRHSEDIQRVGGRLAGIDALDDLLRALFGTVTIGKAILKCIPALVIEPWVDPNSIAAAVPYRAEQGSPLTTRSRLPVLLGALGGVALALVLRDENDGHC